MCTCACNLVFIHAAELTCENKMYISCEKPAESPADMQKVSCTSTPVEKQGVCAVHVHAMSVYLCVYLT